ncbi:MAG: RNA polymerase sigma factor RpoD/SigA [Mycoplasmatota bacterium]
MNEKIKQTFKNYSFLDLKKVEEEEIVIAIMNEYKIIDADLICYILKSFLEKKVEEYFISNRKQLIENYIEITLELKNRSKREKLDLLLLFLNKYNCILTEEECRFFVEKYEIFENIIKPSQKLKKEISDQNEANLIEAYLMSEEEEVNLNDPFYVYKLEMKTSVLLSHEETIELFKQYEESNKTNLEIRNTIVEHNIRLVSKITKRFISKSLDYTDLVQEGILGLLSAIEKFDYKKDVHFSTFAYWYINQAITRAIYNKDKIIRLPVNRFDYNRKIKKAITDYEIKNGKEPTVEELAKITGYTIETISIYYQTLSGITSLNKKIESGDELEDFIPDESCLYDDVEQRELLLSVHKFLDNSGLSNVEREILFYRYGFNGTAKTYSEIGEKFGLTRARIEQITKKAIEKLRASLHNEIFESYIDYDLIYGRYDYDKLFDELLNDIANKKTVERDLVKSLFIYFSKERILNIIDLMKSNEKLTKKYSPQYIAKLKKDFISFLFDRKIIRIDEQDRIKISDTNLRKLSGINNESINSKQEFIAKEFTIRLLKKHEIFNSKFIDLLLEEENELCQNVILDFYGFNVEKEALTKSQVCKKYNISIDQFDEFNNKIMKLILEKYNLRNNFNGIYKLYQRHMGAGFTKVTMNNLHLTSYDHQYKGNLTVYEQFREYSNDDINKVIGILSKEFKEDLKIRYGNNYELSYSPNLSTEEFLIIDSKLYNLILTSLQKYCKQKTFAFKEE